MLDSDVIYAAIVHSADDAIVGKGLDGTVRTWNSAAEALFGYAAGEVIGRSVTVLLPPDLIHEEADSIARILRGERISHFETRRLHKQGRLINVSVSISPVRDATGTIIGASKIARDIGELVASRRREQRLAALLRALARASKLSIQGSTVDETFERICQVCVEEIGAAATLVFEAGDPALRACAGCSPDDARALLGQRCIRSGIEATLAAGDAAVLSTPDLMVAQSAAPSHDPPTQAIALAPFRWHDSRPCVLALVSDAPEFEDGTLLSFVQELATILSLALGNQAREQEFQGIFESAMDAILCVDEQRRIRRFNRAAAAMFQWPAEQAIGQSLDQLVPSPLRAGHADQMREFAQEVGRSPRRMAEVRAVSGVRADGTEFPIEATVSRFGHGADLRLIGVIRDASSLREGEEARSAQAAAEMAKQAQSSFLSQISHELRTPLNAVLGFAHLMQADQKHPLPKTHRERIDHIALAGKHLHSLLSDLLDLGRLDADRLQVNLESVPLSPLLVEVMEALRFMARPTRTTLDLPGALADGLIVRADPTRLRQVLYNLVSNAVKYNRRGGRVWLEFDADEKQVRFSVCDSGAGMDRQQLMRAFEPYQRMGRERGPVEGAGIGLYITKRLVDLMQGTIDLESEAGVGTRVRITLPRSSVNTASRAEATGHAVADDTLEGTVLSIEDNEVNQLLLEALFERFPRVRLLQAVTGAAGLAMARRHRPDLILLDMNLPDIQGRRLLEEFQADSTLSTLKVVVVSASMDPQDVADATDRGALDYVSKPLDLTDFASRIPTYILAPPRTPAHADAA